MRNLTIILICAVSLCPIARAGDAFTRNSVPQKWIEPYLPEDLPDLEYPAYYNNLEKAKLEAFTGRYKKSLYSLMNAPDGDPVEVALVKGTSLAAIGKRQEALAALSSTPQITANPRAQVKRANILADLGRNDEAIALLKDHLSQNANSIAGHYWLGWIYEQVGDLDAARTTYGWFVTAPQDFLDRWQQQRERAFENAEEVTLMGRAIDRWANLTGSYKDLPQMHDTLLGVFVRAYDVIDRSYWPAHLAAAEYFISHDNTTQAVKELLDALKLNPNDVQVCERLGLTAVGNWNFDGADSMVESIRKVDRDSIVADMLEARNLLQQRRPAEAEIPIQRVLTKQPNNIEALGLLAASYGLRLQDDKTAEVLKRVEKLDPDNATAYLEVADQLGAMRQYPRAIAMYKIAIERAPWWTSARNGLGLLYTQSGDEDEAQVTLNLAHNLDPYNLRTTNYLRLLDQLQKMSRKESDHFVVMYDAKIDPMIPEYFTEYLESIHAQVSKTFEKEPPVKTYIEVFPTHDAFSVRTTGSPWIGTVGASTGRVIAMVAPRKGEVTMGPFNWAQVLRHEYTHTITLAATDNRIPHWMTEGLAVWEEQSPLKWEWIPMLYDAVSKKQLFPLDTLTWGFVRPRKPTDRSLAYAQSFWICQYIEKTRGHDAILKMLEQFRNGASEQEAYERILKISQLDFQKEFFAWAEKEVSTWGYDKETSEKYDSLREKGEALISAGKFTDAAKTWEEIVALRPVDELPHKRLAGLYLRMVNDAVKAATPGDEAKAKEIEQLRTKEIEQLKILHAVELKDNRYAKVIGQIYRDMNQLEQAKVYAMQSVYIDPYDLAAHNLLLEIAMKSNDQPNIDREKRVIPILETWIDANRPRPLPR